MNSGYGGITLGSNIAIRIKTNMNRSGYVKDFYVDNVALPNGVSLTPSG